MLITFHLDGYFPMTMTIYEYNMDQSCNLLTVHIHTIEQSYPTSGDDSSLTDVFKSLLSAKSSR